MREGAASPAGLAPGRAGARRPTVEVLGAPPDGVSGDVVRRVLRDALVELGRPTGEVAVRFARDATVRRYNRRFRGIDRPTDVISFPSGEAPGRFLGDLLVSSDRARVQARRAGLPLRREVEELALHGLLHLLGYDHESDGGEMDALELELRARLLDRRRPRAAARRRR